MMCMCVYGCRIGIILVNAISCIQVNNFHHIRLFSLCCPFDFVVFLMHMRFYFENAVVVQA